MKYEELVETITGLATHITQLQMLAVQQQKPVVEHLIRTRSRDVNAIEQTLDRLLDVACHDAGLELFRRLCRYYWTINPESTAVYVLAYRDMWDDAQDADTVQQVAK